MPFTPYLTFDGTCAEAMRFYAEVFGADDLMMMPFSDAPPEIGMPAVDRVMHAQFTVDGNVLMASDGMPDGTTQPQASVSVSYAFDTIEAGRAVFDQLAEGGAVIMPYEATFFSSAFGMVKDRFGTHWMIMLDEEMMPPRD